MSDYQILTVEQTAGGGLALRRKDADEVVSPGASPVIGTASGFPVILGDAAAGRRFQSVRIPFGPVQAGTGDPSPSNIRKLTPRTPAFYRCGTNLYTGEGDTPNTAYNSEGVIGPSSAGAKLTDHIPVSGESEIVLLVWNGSSSVTYSAIRVGMYDADGNLLNGGTGFYKRTTSTGIFTGRIPLSDGTATVRVSFFGQWNLGVYAGSAAKDLTLTLPDGSVGGGVWDPVSGTLTVDRVMESHTWSEGLKSATFTNVERRIIRLTEQNKLGEGASGAYCNIAPYMYSYTYDTTHYYFGNKQAIVFLPLGTAEDTAIQIVFRLVNPVVYQLTPVQIAALAGKNAVWADCGPVSVEYVRDTGAAIEAGDADTRAMIGEVSGETASRSLAVGEYITVGAALYRVTAAVGQGETLVPGSNVVETTVGAELVRLAGMLAQ